MLTMWLVGATVQVPREFGILSVLITTLLVNASLSLFQNVARGFEARTRQTETEALDFALLHILLFLSKCPAEFIYKDTQNSLTLIY